MIIGCMSIFGGKIKMGYNWPQWFFLRRCMKKIIKDDIKDKQMLELGCQIIRQSVRESIHWKKKTSKSYFKSIGFKVVSIDISGCCGSKVVDLRHPIREDFYNKFDIVTNSGTTEHVLPLEGQYDAFRNIHLCTKVGGIMWHFLPEKKKYLGHCQIYYNMDFFYQLALLNSYKIIEICNAKKRKTTSWIGSCFIKEKDIEFTSDRNKFFSNIHYVKKEKVKKHRKNKNKYFYCL
jgi:hypothetical protein